MPEPLVVPRRTWRGWQDRHHDAVDALTEGHAERRRRGVAHPVTDFLFTYYSTRVGAIRRWHPGPGLLLAGADDDDRAGWRHYRPVAAGRTTGLVVDAGSVAERTRPRVDRARAIVAATLDRPGATGCFGLHEWAMLYRTDASGVRHGSVPLRLSHDRIDRVVEASDLRCTHLDAFRFFTPEAVPRNATALTREGQSEHEQPGCLHAGMDLYHAATQLEAGCPGELLVDCLQAAADAREVDMRSSPYDLTDWGLAPIPVETPAGRAEFVAFQRGWIRRTQVLRRRLLAAVDRVGSQPGGAAGDRAPKPRATDATTAASRS